MNMIPSVLLLQSANQCFFLHFSSSPRCAFIRPFSHTHTNFSYNSIHRKPNTEAYLAQRCTSTIDMKRTWTGKWFTLDEKKEEVNVIFIIALYFVNCLSKHF